VTGGDPGQVGPAALVEAHVGPTTQHPKADVVVWLCPPCALELTDHGERTLSDKGQPW
jgi:hypothetical protein